MHTSTGKVTEIYLDSSGHIECAAELVPAPGQYLLAHTHGSDSPVAAPVFFYGFSSNGFRGTTILDSLWTPGTQLDIRGPLGHGFALPKSAHKIALVALDNSPVRLHGLISLGLKQNSEIVLVCDSALSDLPEAVEVQPVKTVNEVCKWADFIAFDVARENPNQLREMFRQLEQVPAMREAQVLIRTSMPCGGLAECGVCAVTISHDWKMTCKDGPVFFLKDVID